MSDTVSLVDVANRQVLAEHKVGDHPTSIAKFGNDRVLVSCSRSGTIVDLKFDSEGLHQQAEYQVGFEPVGLAVDSANQRAYVGQAAGSSVAVIDLQSKSLTRRIEVGPWPRYLTLSPDSRRLAIGCSGDGKVYVVDTSNNEVLYDEPFSGGINLGHMQSSRDGKYAYVPWMIYRTNPINVRNIQLGWVLASRIARVRLDGSADREAIALDVPRIAIADPHGLAITDNEHRLAVTASGTHELLVYRLNDLPFEGAGGPGDLIDRRLLADRDMFYRIELGGRRWELSSPAIVARPISPTICKMPSKWSTSNPRKLANLFHLDKCHRAPWLIAVWKYSTMAGVVSINGIAVTLAITMAVSTPRLWIRRTTVASTHSRRFCLWKICIGPHLGHGTAGKRIKLTR